MTHMRHAQCPKVSYESKRAAKTALRACQERARLDGEQITLRKERRVYRCPSCGCWHLTSRPHWRWDDEQEVAS